MALADRPLTGKTILLTRARGDNEPLRRQLEALGAEVVELPAIAVLLPEDPGPLETAVRNVGRYTWVCFTSRNAVRAVSEMLERTGRALPSHVRIGAIGAATVREIEGRGLQVDCRPETATGAALATAMVRAGAASTRVLLPQSDLARPELRDGLEAGGAIVDMVIAYRTVQPPIDDDVLALIRAGRIDIAVLSSPSALHGLLGMLGDNDLLSGTRLACIGPTTASAVTEAGLVPAAVAPHPTLDGLIEAVRACALETYS